MNENIIWNLVSLLTVIVGFVILIADLRRDNLKLKERIRFLEKQLPESSSEIITKNVKSEAQMAVDNYLDALIELNKGNNELVGKLAKIRGEE